MSNAKAPCRTTQHCAYHGWCRRCDPDFAATMGRINIAIKRSGIDTRKWAALYSAIAVALWKGKTAGEPAPAPQGVQEAVIHACPVGSSGIMPCCGRTPFEVFTERITAIAEAVTCKGLFRETGSP